MTQTAVSRASEGARERGKGMDRETEGEKHVQGCRLGFRQKCQMSQRHSGKTVLFNMAPQSPTQAGNLQ